MTPDEARAFAQVIAKELTRQGLGFVLVVEGDALAEHDPGQPVGGWYAGGNLAGIANMIRAVLAGVATTTLGSDCVVCTQALEDMRAALQQLTPAGEPAIRSCH